MHEPIKEFPKGIIIGSVRLAKGSHIVDVSRLKYGSRTRFVQKVTHKNSLGQRVITQFTKSDDFPSDRIANRFIGEWLGGITKNREYKVIHKDDQFDTFDSLKQQQKSA